MVTYKCKICKKELKGGCQQVIFDLIEHANTEHPKEVKEVLKDGVAYNKELFDLETQLQEKYQNWNGGYVDLFEEIPIKPRTQVETDAQGDFDQDQEQARQDAEDEARANAEESGERDESGLF